MNREPTLPKMAHIEDGFRLEALVVEMNIKAQDEDCKFDDGKASQWGYIPQQYNWHYDQCAEDCCCRVGASEKQAEDLIVGIYKFLTTLVEKDSQSLRIDQAYKVL
jgi:hypothetical protein